MIKSMQNNESKPQSTMNTGLKKKSYYFAFYFCLILSPALAFFPSALQHPLDAID